ncbi:uncharacterized protein LOC135054941 [Pseudophryne corroboree]|uniref:uncharacterized protein LOC135054941 n=1 Tax=Pseudophryne corroboree TaxID=495146 RepID=UPI00308140FB
MVPVSTINTGNGEVSCETPDGTVINININQRSALDSLRALRIKAKSHTGTKPTRGTAHGASLWLGATLISLGCVCVMLAVILCVVQPYLFIFYTGTHFWVGFPLIVSGVLSVVSYTYPKACWEPTHPFKVGDRVVVKVLPRNKSPGDFTYGPETEVVAVTRTAVLTEESPTWIHASRVKKVPRPDLEREASDSSEVQTGADSPDLPPSEDRRTEEDEEPVPYLYPGDYVDNPNGPHLPSYS